MNIIKQDILRMYFLENKRIEEIAKHYGMSSHKAQEKYGGIKSYRASEGRVITVPYKGDVSEVINDVLGGIRSACAYVGASSLKDLPKCADNLRDGSIKVMPWTVNPPNCCSCLVQFQDVPPIFYKG
mgnify:CR=1 FL=1